MADTGVYLILSKVDGKVYVGSAGVSFKKRWRQHITSLRTGKHVNVLLQRAWNKHGEENFDFQILEKCDPLECVSREQFYIDKYEACSTKKGYNLSPTAGSMLGYVHTEASRVKMSASAKQFFLRNPALAEKRKERLTQYYSDPVIRKKVSDRVREYNNVPENRERNRVAGVLRFKDPAVRRAHGEAIKAATSSPEYRQSQSKKSKAVWANEEYRLRMVERRREVSSSPEAKAAFVKRIQEANSTPEAKAGMSARSKSLWQDPAYVEKVKKGHTRRGPVSEETREKISRAGKGRKVSQETKAKISAKAKGKPRTEAQKKHLSEINKGKTDSAETVDRKRQKAREMWADPERREKILRRMRETAARRSQREQ
jgi:group I intron endonuclease